MSSLVADPKANTGLATCLSNVFKLAEIEGLKWTRYLGPNSSSLEVPRSDPVLTSYATLLSDGYACSWRRLSPSTDGMSGESKDLWIFYFTALPDLTGKLSTELQEDSSGSWEDGMNTESSAMLFRALNSLIERSLLSENFLPLGKWFARPDPTMGSDGRGCFLCSFSFFIHAHLFICASVDVRAGPALQPLLTTHLQQALASSSGMQVILSPSGLNAIMTGHSYRLTDPGIEELLEEWKLFYPRRFEFNAPSSLPAAVEVVLGGVRLRYPSQFVFVYHTEEAFPTPPPSPIDENVMEKVVRGGWEETSCIDPIVQQKQCEECTCSKMVSHSVRDSRPSRPVRLTPSDSLKSERKSSRHRVPPYTTGSNHPTDNATPMKEHPMPSSLSLGPPTINSKRKVAVPKYSTLPSPAVTMPSPSLGAKHPNALPLPSLSVTHATASSPTNTGGSKVPSHGSYNMSRAAEIVASLKTDNGRSHSLYNSSGEGWWKCMKLPENQFSIQRAIQPVALPSPIGLPGGPMSLPHQLQGIGSSGPGTSLASMLSPGTKTVPSSLSSSRVETPTLISTPTSVTTPTKRRASSSRGRGGAGRGKVRRTSEVVTPASVLDPHYQEEVAADAHVIIPVNNNVNGRAMTGVNPSLLKPGGSNLDLTSDNAIKITGNLGSLFDDSEDEEDIPKTSTGDTSTMRIAKTKLMSGALQPPSIDLSRIYPTPPSVESNEDKYDDSKLMNGEDVSDIFENNLMSKLSPFDDVIMGVIPNQFSPLPNIYGMELKKQLVYTKTSMSGSVNEARSLSQSSSAHSNKSEPQKFIFPPPSSIARPTHSLTLPLVADKDANASPMLPTPFASHHSSPHRLSGRFPRHLPSSAHTPLESPFDAITPTPMSSQRLVPVLPEAHALYINLALLDSALGANVSDSVTISMTAIQNFMLSRSSWRTKLDSVGSTPGGPLASAGLEPPPVDGSGGLFKLEDEKPLMMAGIADYPSLGFREDQVVSTPNVCDNSSNTGSGLPKLGNGEVSEKRVKQFLTLVQDYCIHLCLSGRHDGGGVASSVNSVKAQPYQQKHKHVSKTTCRLYHTHSVSSAILCGKQLVPTSRGHRPPMSAVPGGAKPSLSPVQLDKLDNSAAWILDLLSLPTKFVTKKLKELRSVFQSSFHHAPCIKVATKGPLSLRDLQTLTPSQTPVGDECTPLPMQPVVVGHEYEWISVSPLALPAWEKLTLEPYSSPKNILYVVVSPDGEEFVETLKCFFNNLSIMYKSCKLGAHIPLDKATSEDGIITKYEAPEPPVVIKKEKDEESSEPTPTPAPATTTDDNSESDISDGPLSTLESICRNMIGPCLSKLPTSNEDLIECSTKSSSISNSLRCHPVAMDTPTCIVIYIVMKDDAEYIKKTKKDVIDVMRIFSSILSNKNIPSETQIRTRIQPVELSELVSPHANCTHHLRSMAFSVFARCRPPISLYIESFPMTGFGPAIERPKPSQPLQLYQPLYVLSSDPILSSNPLAPLPQQQQPSAPTSVFGQDDVTLHCAYCVSVDQRWLLGVVCDKQGELLDTCVIGLQQNEMDGNGSRNQALRKLWAYLVSTLKSSVISWNLIITRLGKPSSSEIREWPQIVSADGLLTINSILKGDCHLCVDSVYCPSLKNVIFLSIQPERNIQLFPTNDPGPSISHVLVLPPHPNALLSTTPTDDAGGFDFTYMDPGGADGSDNLLGVLDDDLFSGLNSIDMEYSSTTVGAAPGVEDVRTPLATGYLISTTPSGDLPNEFWGHDGPQGVCNMFKALLHSHLSVNAFPGNPPDVLCSVLVSFNALSWLSINHSAQQRNSPLPIHLFLLAKLYNFFSLLSASTR